MKANVCLYIPGAFRAIMHTVRLIDAKYFVAVMLNPIFNVSILVSVQLKRYLDALNGFTPN